MKLLEAKIGSRGGGQYYRRSPVSVADGSLGSGINCMTGNWQVQSTQRSYLHNYDLDDSESTQLSCTTLVNLSITVRTVMFHCEGGRLVGIRDFGVACKRKELASLPLHSPWRDLVRDETAAPQTPGRKQILSRICTSRLKQIVCSEEGKHTECVPPSSQRSWGCRRQTD